MCACVCAVYVYCSSSSSYSDLMPRFLRAIRALCCLYPHYQQALQQSEIAGASASVPHSVPTSPATLSSSDPLQQAVQRASSFGTLLDNNAASQNTHPRTQTVPAPNNLVHHSTRDHRRTHSQTIPSEEAWHAATSLSGETPPIFLQSASIIIEGGRLCVLRDPFAKLETVWASLESWFDLILTEVEKTARDLVGGSLERGRDLLRKRMVRVGGAHNKGASDSADSATAACSPETSRAGETEREGETGPVTGPSTVKGEGNRPAVVDSAEEEGESTERKRRDGLGLNLAGSNEVAAAIVKSTPIERRVAYLG